MASPLASVWVKNTFLEFRQEDQQDDDDDLWIDLPKPLTRQVTDSILDQQSRYGLCGNRAELPQRTKENHPQVTDDVDRKLSDASTGTPEYEEEGSLPGNQISEPEKEIEPALREAFEGATGLWPDDEDEDVSDSGIGENSDAIIEAVSAVANRRALMKHLGENGQAHPDGGSGTCPLRGRTTVMMRHIPCKYTQQKVMKEINHAGFLGRYDFFYLPMDSRSRSNRGFAFINLDSPAAAEAFFQTFDGKKLRRYEAVKALAVMPADLQGFERNAVHFATSHNLRRKRNTDGGPLFFRPLPAHLVGASALQQGRCEAQETEPNYMCHQEHFPAEEYQAYAQAWNPFAYGQWHSSSSTAQLEQSSTQAREESTRKFCTMCGKPQAQHHNFCTYCGSKAEI